MKIPEPNSEPSELKCSWLRPERGACAAILQDFPVNYDRASKDDLFVLTGTIETDEEYGFAVEKGDTETLDLLNRGLQKIEDDGRLDTIYDRYFPEAELFINDYNTEFPEKRADYLELIGALQQRGVPIDGVGHQAHMDFARPVQWLDDSLTRSSSSTPTCSR